MQRTMPPNSDTPWSVWKRDWADNFKTAAVAACLEAWAFALFLYMFSQDGYRLLIVVAGGLAVFWLFHVGVSALHAHLLSHPRIAPIYPPTDSRAH